MVPYIYLNHYLEKSINIQKTILDLLLTTKIFIKKENFKYDKYKTIGGPFTSAMYFWDQAIQYLKGPLKPKDRNGLKTNLRK